MTRIVIFSDLHANWEALLALQQVERRPDAVFCLGDTVGYGPDPKRCLDAVRASATAAIGGWQDRAVAHNHTHAAALPASTWDYTRLVLPAGDRAYLAGLPRNLTICTAQVRFHLTRLPPDDHHTETAHLVTAPAAALRQHVAAAAADLILIGGPHLPALRQLDGRLLVCPGSLGQPRYGVPDPTFAVWEDGRVQIHHLHYNPQPTARKLGLLPLDPDEISQLQAWLTCGA